MADQTEQVTLFISCVSAEFGSYREAPRKDLERHNVSVKIQQDFIAHNKLTLDKLDEYIRRCDMVIHLVGDMTGADAHHLSAAGLLEKYPDLPNRVPAFKIMLEISIYSFGFVGVISVARLGRNRAGRNPCNIRCLNHLPPGFTSSSSLP